jgi:hypothetical protein
MKNRNIAPRPAKQANMTILPLLNKSRSYETCSIKKPSQKFRRSEVQMIIDIIR